MLDELFLGRKPAQVGAVFAEHRLDRFYADCIDAGRNRLNRKLDQTIVAVDQAIHGLVDGVNRTGSGRGVTENRPVGTDKPNRSGGNEMIAARDLDKIEPIDFGRSPDLVRNNHRKILVRHTLFLIRQILETRERPIQVLQR